MSQLETSHSKNQKVSIFDFLLKTHTGDVSENQNSKANRKCSCNETRSYKNLRGAEKSGDDSLQLHHYERHLPPVTLFSYCHFIYCLDTR